MIKSRIWDIFQQSTCTGFHRWCSKLCTKERGV